MNLRKLALALSGSFVLGGCATAPKPEIQFLSKPFTLRLAQVPMTDREAVRTVVAKDQPKDDPQAEQETSQAIEAAHTQALMDMNSALAAFPDLHVDGSPLKLPPSLETFPIVNRDQPLPPNILDTLRGTSNADALLRFGISDYGLTPKAWRSGVITFEVVSTLGIAAIAYARPATRAIAGAYLAQETI